MNCNDVQEQILVALRGSKSLSKELMAHLSNCKDCSSVKNDIEFSLESLNAISNIKAPQNLTKNVHRQILSEFSPKKSFKFESSMPIIFGLLATMITFFLANLNVDLSKRPLSEILISGMLWTISFSTAFHILIRRTNGKGNGTSVLVKTGLLATGAFFLIDSIIPLSSVVDFCNINGLPKFLIGVVGLKGLFLVLGTIYAVVPLFLFSLATAKKYKGTPVRGALIAGGMFFFLIAPSIFLQCQSFTTGALIAWLGGALVGSSFGSIAGIKVYRYSVAHA